MRNKKLDKNYLQRRGMWAKGMALLKMGVSVTKKSDAIKVAEIVSNSSSKSALITAGTTLGSLGIILGGKIYLQNVDLVAQENRQTIQLAHDSKINVKIQQQQAIIHQLQSDLFVVQGDLRETQDNLLTERLKKDLLKKS